MLYLRHILPTAAAAALSFSGLGTIASARTTLKCRPADARTESLIYGLKWHVTSQDTAIIRSRDSVYHIPVVPVSQISVVTDERVCTKVIQAYAALAHGAYTPSRVYVIKMGSKYTVAQDPDVMAGDFSIVHIFDSKYIEVGGWVGG
jgi:hypothetical protein